MKIIFLIEHTNQFYNENGNNYKPQKSKKYFGATPHKDRVLLEEKKRDRDKRTAALVPVSRGLRAKAEAPKELRQLSEQRVSEGYLLKPLFCRRQNNRRLEGNGGVRFGRRCRRLDRASGGGGDGIAGAARAT